MKSTADRAVQILAAAAIFLLFSKNVSSQPLVQPSDLQYVGAFRLPQGDFGGSRFGYGGTALAFHPTNNSLFLVGHVWEQMVAEVSIPAPVASANLDELPTATVLQNFADASDGLLPTADDEEVRVGGLLVASGRLIGSGFTYYDGDGGQVLSHFTSPTNLATPVDAQGLFRLGAMGAGFVSGYMAHLPTVWQSVLGGRAVVGNCCLPIISRTSYGPAAFAFEPDELGGSSPVVVTPLVFYPSDHPLEQWDGTNPKFNGTTEIRGIALPEGSRSLLFFGRHGAGKFCYGTGEECDDPAISDKGTHGYPYVYQVWAYDLLDLAKVRQGILQPWEVEPYEIWQLQLPFPEDKKNIGGVAYDPARKLLYLSQQWADSADALPLIHVFKIEISSGSSEASPDAAATFCQILPNPVVGDVFQIETDEQLAAVEVFSAAGRLCFFTENFAENAFDKNLVDISALPPGVFSVKIWLADGRVAVRRLVKI